MREALPEVCIHATLLTTDSQCCSCFLCFKEQITASHINQAAAAAAAIDMTDEC